MSAAEQRPWLWAVYCVVCLLLILLLSFCLCPRSGPVKVGSPWPWLNLYYIARYTDHADVGCGTTSLAVGSILCSLFITNSLTLLLSLSKIWTSEGRFTLTLVKLVLSSKVYRPRWCWLWNNDLAVGSILCSLFITNSLTLLLSLS